MSSITLLININYTPAIELLVDGFYKLYYTEIKFPNAVLEGHEVVSSGAKHAP